MRYSQIKQALKEAEIIDEVSMSPSSLEAFANSPEAEGMLIGIEFEMCVPNASTGDDEPEWEYDWEANESAYDINEIINFFRNGDFSNMGRSDAERARNDLWEEYLDWSYEAANRYIDDNSDELDGKIRERLEDEVSREEAEEEARTRWAEANPDEDADSDEASAEIRDITSQIIEDRLDELMQDTSGSEYQYAYDQARQEMEDDFRSGGDGDESAWLSDIGVGDMQDASRQWNFDWPHMYDANEGGGDADVDQVADDFSAHTGYSARGYTNYHSGSRSQQQEQGYFIIEPDGSIDTDTGNDAGLEFISPAMPLKDGLAMIKKVKDWASAAGCYTNKSTGLHMNISVPNMTVENLDYVKLALFLGDEYVLSEFNRSYNSYAKSAMKIVKEKIQQNPENATALLAKMKEHVNAAASKLVHSGITQKYTSINTKDKYVEFRGPGGDYLDQDIPKLLNTALRAAQALRIATDDGAYKQEYAKKLYKLISPEGEWTDPNNSVALFSRYALGQINKSELVNNVRQAQVARKEKKGEEQQYWVMNKDGSGGKQMVFATSSTEAIIKGGSQMGMKREDSISKLRAELMDKPQSDSAPESLSQSWKDWVEDTLPNVTVDTANSVRERIKDGRDNLDAAASAWIIRQIDNELRSRMDQGVVDGSETRWKVYIARGEYAERPIDAVYVDADTPRQAKLKAAEIFTRQLNIVTLDTNDLEAQAASAEEGREEQSWIVLDGFNRPAGTVQARSSDEALRIFGSTNNVNTRNYTAVPGAGNTTNTTGREEFDSLPSGWQEFLSNISTQTGGALQNMIDMVANGQAHSARDLSIEQRDAIIGTINVELRRRREQPAQDPLNSLSQSWQTWLGQVGTHANETLENMLRTIEAGTGDVVRMTPEQRNLITTTIHQELRSRQTTNYNTLAANAARAENVVFQSLPDAHREWLSEVGDKSDMDLINVLRNLSAAHNDSILSDQQKAYFRITIKHELRRRGINPDSEPAQAQGNYPQSQQVEPEIDLSSPDDENIHDIMGEELAESINLIRRLAGIL
jgi:hypothetical protein